MTTNTFALISSRLRATLPSWWVRRKRPFVWESRLSSLPRTRPSPKRPRSWTTAFCMASRELASSRPWSWTESKFKRRTFRSPPHRTIDTTTSRKRTFWWARDTRWPTKSTWRPGNTSLSASSPPYHNRIIDTAVKEGANRVNQVYFGVEGNQKQEIADELIDVAI